MSPPPNDRPAPAPTSRPSNITWDNRRTPWVTFFLTLGTVELILGGLSDRTSLFALGLTTTTLALTRLWTRPPKP